MTEFALSVLELIGYFLVLYLLGRILIERLEKSLGSFVERLPIQRLRRIGSAEFDPPTQVAAGEIEPPAVTMDRTAVAPAPDPSSVPGHYEAVNREWLETVRPEDRERQLAMGLLHWQVGWFFEYINFSILGSQLGLLGEVNVRPVSVEQARARYQDAAAAYPDYFSNYSFDQWLVWLSDSARAVRVEGANVFITDDGREFLRYIVGRGYPTARSG
jgi:hypothetical protein